MLYIYIYTHYIYIYTSYNTIMIYLFIIEFESSDSVGERCIFETIPCSSLDNPWPCCSKASPATKRVHSDDLPADGAICSEFAALGLRNLRNLRNLSGILGEVARQAAQTVRVVPWGSVDPH